MFVLLISVSQAARPIAHIEGTWEMCTERSGWDLLECVGRTPHVDAKSPGWF